MFLYVLTMLFNLYIKNYSCNLEHYRIEFCILYTMNFNIFEKHEIYFEKVI